MPRPAFVVNENDVSWEERSQGDRFGCRRRAIGAAAGRLKLGASIYEIAPGRSPWPFHHHLGNEESIYVLEGSGTLRTEDGKCEIRTGDYVALPPGSGSGHEVINTSGAPLRVLILSTMIEPDVVIYPDSEKVGVIAGSAPCAIR